MLTRAILTCQIDIVKNLPTCMSDKGVYGHCPAQILQENQGANADHASSRKLPDNRALLAPLQAAVSSLRKTRREESFSVEP